MSTAALGSTGLQHDAFAPRRPGGTGPGLVLALIAHALLVAALAWSVRWHASEPDGIVAELWSPTVQQAAPRAEPTQPQPQPTPQPQPRPPEPVRQPPPVPRVETPPPLPRVDPQIAIDRAAKEKATRAEAEREERAQLAEKRKADQAKKDKAEKEKEKDKEKEKADREEAKRAEAKADAEQAKKDEARLAAARAANLKRMMAQAGGAEAGTTGGTAARTSGPSAGYAGRIRARVKPNIVLTGSVAGNPVVEIEVRLAPDGTIVGRRITKSSGSPVWDETVLRAIDKTEILPRDVDGRVPPVIPMEFRPLE